MTHKTKGINHKVQKMCLLLNTITKMDIRLLDQNARPSLEFANHTIPSVIQNEKDDYSIIQTILKQHPSTSYYDYVNSYGLGYIAAGIWNMDVLENSVVIGPIISSTSSKDVMSNIIANNQLPVSQRSQLLNFYNSLPVVSSEQYVAIGELMVNLFHHEPIQVQQIRTQPQQTPSINKEKLAESIAESKNTIELRYETEKDWMDLVSKGDKKAGVFLSSGLDNLLLLFSSRYPDSPIRAAKNSALILNTLCRVAVEKGGVHPVYIHHISEKFAILAERVSTLNQLKDLVFTMVNEYCELVTTYSTRNYSPIVKKAVDYIQLHLENPLTLNEIAAAIHVNSTHLSRRFKEDTKMNVIEYIHYKRVEEAKFYLLKRNKTIIEIAFLVGFNDVNYFTRVFKKVTSLTPSQYIKSMNTNFDEI